MANPHQEYLANRAKLLHRLQQEGKLKDYRARATMLRQEGRLPRHIAEIGAALLAEFAPTDGSPAEFRQSDYDDRVRALTVKPRTDMGPAVEGVSPETDARFTAAVAINTERKKGRAEERWEQLRKDVVDVWKRGKSRVGRDEATVARWIFSHAESQPDELDPYEVPGVGALRFLKRIQASDAAYDDFIRTCFSKMLTKGLDGDPEFAYGPQGAKHLSMMERLREIDVDDDLETVKAVMSSDDGEQQSQDGDDGILDEDALRQLGTGADGPEGERGVSDQGLEGG